MRIWSKGVWLALAVVVVGCQMPEATPDMVGNQTASLVGGDVDTGDPAVVAVKLGGELCTGTLISPSVVLTASHCIGPTGGAGGRITIGSDFNGSAVEVGVKLAWGEPDWSIGNHDLAMALLDVPVRDVKPLPLNTTPATDLIGHDYRMIGFGVNDGATQTIDGKKRTGMVTIDDAKEPPGGDNIIINNATTSVCFGDSGGPGLVSDGTTEYVAGIHSWTSNKACDPPNGDTRVDLYVDDVIKPWIAKYDPTCGHDYLCVTFGCDNDPDCEPCGADGTCTSGCALPDPDCPTSDIGEICQTDSQCKSGMCVTWRAEPHSKFCSRPCDTDACPSGMSCQTVDPQGDVCYYDDPPPGVLGDPCETATDCGSYQCEQGQCVYNCDLSVGQGCPADFACQQGASGDYVCISTAKDAPGGCCGTGAGAGGGSALLLGICALLLAPLRRR